MLPVQQPEAPAAYARTVRFHHRQCGADRHRRIEGIAPGPQHLEARLCAQRMRACDTGLCRQPFCNSGTCQQPENKKAPQGSLPEPLGETPVSHFHW